LFFLQLYNMLRIITCIVYNMSNNDL